MFLPHLQVVPDSLTHVNRTHLQAPLLDRNSAQLACADYLRLCAALRVKYEKIMVQARNPTCFSWKKKLVHVQRRT